MIDPNAMPKPDSRIILLLGCFVLLGAGFIAVLVIVGCYLIITGTARVEQSLLAVCTGIVGTILGAITANAQQIVSFYFTQQGKKE